MPKFFAKLNKRTVTLPLSEGKSLTVPLLPISELPEMDAISEQLAKLDRDNARGIAERMIALAKKSLPDSEEALHRFQLDELAELLSLLMYGTSEPDADGGDGGGEEGDGEKKA